MARNPRYPRVFGSPAAKAQSRAAFAATGGAPTPTPSPSPTIAFASPTATVPEGNSGTTTVTNTVNVVRNGVTGALTINLTYGGTAAGGVDYATAPTSVTIGAGQSSGSFDILINGDTTVEPDETIVITAALSGYAGVTATKTITITNDDVAVTLSELRTSGLLTNGLASSGVINGVEIGYTPTTTQSGLTVGPQASNGAWPYTWDGTGAAGTTASALAATKSGSPAQSGPAIVLPASTGNLKLSGRMFFVGEPAFAGILAGYASTSVLSATSDDGTALRVTTDGQGYPIVAPSAAGYAFATSGVKVITITETPSSGSPTVSTMAIYVAPAPTPMALAKAKPLLQRLLDERAAQTPIAVGSSPPTITVNTGASLVNGRSLAAGGSTPNASVPQGRSGVAGSTALASGYIYADTTNGPTAQTFAPGPTFEWLFTGTVGSIFDFKVSYPGTPPFGTNQIMIFYCEDYDTARTWVSATAEPHNFANAVAYYTVNFGSAPARAGSRAVRVMLGQGMATTGFNFEASATIATFDGGKLRGAAWNDSYEFSTALDHTINTPVHTLMRYLGSFNGINFGHRTNAWTRLGGTTGIHARVADRFGSNPWALDEMTRFGSLDVAQFHMSINDHVTFGYNAIPTSSNAPKFNNAAGSNAIIPGADTLYGWLLLAFRRARYMQPKAFFPIDAGYAPPDGVPASAYLTVVRNAFVAAFDGDPLALFYDYTTETVRYRGADAASGQAVVITSGAAGSSPYFGVPSTAITATSSGDVLTVSAVSSGRLETGAFISTGATGGNVIAKQLTGTAGGVGTYRLLLPQADVTSATAMTYNGDKDHPNEPGNRLRPARNAQALVAAAQLGVAA